MKLMAIIGSPRKGGNTETLVDKVIEGCKSKAHKGTVADKEHELQDAFDVGVLLATTGG